MLTMRWSRTARKTLPYTIEPLTEGPTSWWEGFCTTNPTMVRLPGDDRVFLGYRAAGSGTSFFDGHAMIWASSLGMAILDATGERVLQRFPLPIVYRAPDVPLPQDKAAYDAFIAEHGQREIVMHDFRFWLRGERLYLIYHSAGLNKCHDCIASMAVESFRDRIAQSQALLANEPLPSREAWGAIWWGDSVWTPEGVDGTHYVYGSYVNKNDIVFYDLADGTLRMSHRPYPDMAILPTGTQTNAGRTADGITRYGSIERCIRPGYFDNAHIGPNGAPTPAWIGDVPVTIEITHGVHDRNLTSAATSENWDLIYMPYLRVCDRATGEELYYSAEPITDYDDLWRDYVENGAWIARLDHLQGVMFPGGQLPVHPGQAGLDDRFMFFTGVGDTAVARAEFTLRDLMPSAVIEDIQSRARHAAEPFTLPPVQFALPEPAAGWHWALWNMPAWRGIGIERRLARGAEIETAMARVLPRPGRFDADGLSLLPGSITLVEDLGWVVLYQGVRWTEQAGRRRTETGLGVLLLDAENPERVMYRTEEPLMQTSAMHEGWISPVADYEVPVRWQMSPALAVPEGVRYEWARIRGIIKSGRRDGSHHTRWLQQKSSAAV